MSEFYLQTGASFGKSQLLNGAKLANQNKDKMAGKFKYLQSFSNVAIKPIPTDWSQCA